MHSLVNEQIIPGPVYLRQNYFYLIFYLVHIKGTVKNFW